MPLLEIVFFVLIKVFIFSIPSVLLRYLIFNRPLKKENAVFWAFAITFLIGYIFPFIIEIFMAFFLSYFVLRRGGKNEENEGNYNRPYQNDYYPGDKNGLP